MPQPSPIEWEHFLNMGTAGAVIFVVSMFLKHLRERDETLNTVLRDFTAALNKAIEVIKDSNS